MHLLPHVAQRVVAALAVKLVDGHGVGEVQHVDFLELAAGAELRSHHIERYVHMGDDGGITLADARGLRDDQIETRQFAGGKDLAEAPGHLAAGRAGGQGSHIDALAVDRIHADAVTEQRPAASAPGGIGRDDGDVEGILLIEAEPADDLVGQRRLAGAAGAGDAEHGNGLDVLGPIEDLVAQRRR